MKRKSYLPIGIAAVGFVLFLIGGAIEYPKLAIAGAGLFVFAFLLAGFINRKN